MKLCRLNAGIRTRVCWAAAALHCSRLSSSCDRGWIPYKELVAVLLLPVRGEVVCLQQALLPCEMRNAAAER